MEIVLIGASGTIGKAVEQALSTEHEIITANYSSGMIRVDLSQPESIKALFKATGTVDAVICAAGLANFAPLNALGEVDYTLALQNKLMGQINLLRLGRPFINPQGSITLTSGILSHQPMVGSAVISMANGALESYVKAAALELDALRINVVSPIFVKETMAMMGMDTAGGLSAQDTAKAYIDAVTGAMHGETLVASEYA